MSPEVDSKKTGSGEDFCGTVTIITDYDRRSNFSFCLELLRGYGIYPGLTQNNRGQQSLQLNLGPSFEGSRVFFCCVCVCAVFLISGGGGRVEGRDFQGNQKEKRHTHTCCKIKPLQFLLESPKQNTPISSLPPPPTPQPPPNQPWPLSLWIWVPPEPKATPAATEGFRKMEPSTEWESRLTAFLVDLAFSPGEKIDLFLSPRRHDFLCCLLVCVLNSELELIMEFAGGFFELQMSLDFQ